MTVQAVPSGDQISFIGKGVPAVQLTTGVNAQKVENLSDYSTILRTHKPGDEVIIEYMRGSEKRTAPLRLERR